MRPFDFEQIFRQAPTAFSVVDLDGHQLDGSDHYWELFGIDPSSVDPDDAVINRFTDSNDAELTRQYFEQLATGALRDVDLEKRYRRANGERFWGRLRANPILDDDGNMVAIAGVITDITAEREARDALVASEVERSKSDQRVVANAIRSFVGSVEHQARSPLHSILGLTELLTQGSVLSENQCQALHQEALRLQQIIEEVSAFSHHELETTVSPADPRRRRLDIQWNAALEAAAAEQRRVDAAARAAATPSPHVLVVDDGEVNRLLAVSQLHRLGYRASTANNGLEAVARAGQEAFDAILMDWHMPVLDGVEAARRIREQEPAGTNVPIIAITASVVAGDQHDCLDAGMDEVLVKPVPIEALRAALARHVSLAPTPTTPVPSPSRRINQAPTSIDRRALDELELETGDRSVVGVIIDTYLDELEPRLSTIGAAADVMVSGDQAAAKELMRSSHTLKSTAALVGATRLSHLCEQLQVLASDRPGPEAVRLAELVVAEARRTAIDLQTVRSTL